MMLVPLLNFSLFSTFSQKQPLIGFDLGREKLNMVQVDFLPEKPVISCASSDYHNSNYQTLLQQPGILRKLVKSSLKKHGFKGRKIVATLPSSLLQIIYLNFQCKPTDNEAQMLIAALKQRTHEDLSDYVVDYVPINPSSERVNRMALVAMAKRQEVENYLDLLTGCGLKIEALEIGPVAIKRLVSAMTPSTQPQKILTINFGQTRSYLTVIWNNELLLDRAIDFGMENILQAIAKSFDSNTQTALEILHHYGLNKHHDEPNDFTFENNKDEYKDTNIKSVLFDILNPEFFSLAEEVKDVLIYIASETRGGSPERIYLMGSLARVSAVDEIIDHLISIPVKTIDPFYGFQTPKQSHQFDDLGPLAGIAVATGLSMRGKI